MPNLSVASMSDGETGLSRLDLTGKIIIKASLGHDTRRMPIHNDEITYDELILMMQRVFKGKLEANDEVTIKYKDEDGDLVTIADNNDLSFAIQCSRILKITLFVNNQPEPLEPEEAKAIRNGFKAIRDQANYWLDRLEAKYAVSGRNKRYIEEEDIRDSSLVAIPNGDNAKLTSSPKKTEAPREFDPLLEKKDSPVDNRPGSRASSVSLGSSKILPPSSQLNTLPEQKPLQQPQQQQQQPATIQATVQQFQPMSGYPGALAAPQQQQQQQPPLQQNKYPVPQQPYPGQGFLPPSQQRPAGPPSSQHSAYGPPQNYQQQPPPPTSAPGPYGGPYGPPPTSNYGPPSQPPVSGPPPTSAYGAPPQGGPLPPHSQTPGPNLPPSSLQGPPSSIYGPPPGSQGYPHPGGPPPTSQAPPSSGGYNVGQGGPPLGPPSSGPMGPPPASQGPPQGPPGPPPVGAFPSAAGAGNPFARSAAPVRPGNYRYPAAPFPQ